ANAVARLRQRAEAPTRDVHEWLRRPIGLVQVKGVLPRLSIESDQAFVVQAGRAAFAACVARKVERVPDEFTKNERASGQSRPIAFVIVGLVFFGVFQGRVIGARVLYGRVRRVLGDARACTVLGEADGAGRAVLVRLIGPSSKIGDVAAVPALVLVEAMRGAVPIDGVVRVTRIGCVGRNARRIFAGNQVCQVTD